MMSSVPTAPFRPADRYQASPYLAINATCASVSTFCINVGAAATPRSRGWGGVVVGVAMPASMRWTAALDSPATYRCGAAAIRAIRLSTSVRSARARSIAAYAALCSCPTYRTTDAARTVRAARNAPSRMRWGRVAMSSRSL
ncbi:MAG: hypothetical protein AUH76_16710 [Candidatus Rokubacteria bacterium 13_1_40CM_4_67_11]|nr:MAG: hypothetical protein AUH76_16710 [Candidatus Rokubacteria bacterium 13_1_40CM_4_67_11]